MQDLNTLFKNIENAFNAREQAEAQYSLAHRTATDPYITVVNGQPRITGEGYYAASNTPEIKALLAQLHRSKDKMADAGKEVIKLGEVTLATTVHKSVAAAREWLKNKFPDRFNLLEPSMMGGNDIFDYYIADGDILVSVNAWSSSDRWNYVPCSVTLFGNLAKAEQLVKEFKKFKRQQSKAKKLAEQSKEA